MVSSKANLFVNDLNKQLQHSRKKNIQPSVYNVRHNCYNFTTKRGKRKETKTRPTQRMEHIGEPVVVIDSVLPPQA